MEAKEEMYTGRGKPAVPKLKNGDVSPVPTRTELMEKLDRAIMLLQTGKPITSQEIAAVITQIRESIGLVFDENDDLKFKLEALKKLVTTHETKIQTLTKDIAKLQRDIAFYKNSMIMGQVMSCLERKMVKEILTGTTVATSLTLYQIEQLLEGKKSRFLPDILAEDREIVATNWNSLDRKYGFTKNLYSQLLSIKDNRNDIAHPGMTVDTAATMIIGNPNISNDEQAACKQALDTLKRMNVTTITW